MINTRQFVQEILFPTLNGMSDAIGFDCASPAAVRLMIGTVAVESNFTAIRQYGSGPARGLFQMEPATARDLFNTYMNRKPALNDFVLSLVIPHIDLAEQLSGNMYLATALARVRYLRVSEKLPDFEDTEGLARYWKRFYNTSEGRGTEKCFLERFSIVNHLVKEGVIK